MASLKDLETVKSIITQLKTMIENEYELHRIEILERDLVEGLPKVEEINQKKQFFNGITYKLNTGGHFSTGTHNSIHRAVWMYYCGEIPENYIVHHIDHDKTNNDILNLQLMTKKQHACHHNQKGSRCGVPVSKEFICDECGEKYVAFDIGQKAHFCSKSCREKAKNKRIVKSLICPQCGKEFTARKFSKTKFCSKECAQIYNHAKAIEMKTCPVCGKIFESYKYRQQECCSPECGNKWKYIKRQELHICEACGKEFIRYTKTKKFCDDCAKKRRVIAQKNSRKLQSKYASMRETRTCPVCGKEFLARKQEVKECCSRSCRSKLRCMKEAAAKLKQIKRRTQNKKNDFQTQTTLF